MDNHKCDSCKKTFRRYTDLAFHIVAGCTPKKKGE